MESIKTRRTIRHYQKRDVDQPLLMQLLADAARTQTMGNLQLYSVIVTRSEDMKKQLAPAHFNQPMVTEAPVVLTVCADFNRTTQWARHRNANPGYDNALSFANAATDALLFTQTFCNLAEEAGLGVCFLGTTIYQPQHVIEVLKLPPLTFPVATLTIGWPDEKPPLTDRLPVDAFVHKETYHDYSPQDIDAYYTAKEQLPENRHFVDINHKDTLAQVYTDIRYTKSDNETLSEILVNALKNQKFI